MRHYTSCIALLIAASVTATAAEAGECKRLAAAGDGLTKDIAIFMANKGLQNVIEGYGMKGKGPVKTTCENGTIVIECHSSQMACK